MAAIATKPKFAKFIKVSADNNNKYYEMSWDGVATSFNVKYGRVESTAVTRSYPISQWDKVAQDRIKHGYKEVTDYVTVEQTNDSGEPTKLGTISDMKVEEFMSLMKKYTDGLVSKTYSVKANAVTQAQVDAAQNTIDKLLALDPKGKNFQAKANEWLLELYTIIPRNMGKTTNYLLPAIAFDKTMDQEQANLDAMAGQVAMLKPKDTKKTAKTKKEVKTLLDVLGITMVPHKDWKKDPELAYLIKQITGNKIEAIFTVNKPAEDVVFDKHVAGSKDKSTRILIHGTKCTSVIPILEIGLKIRPTGNFQFSGKVYGNGNYFSEVVNKSLNYTGYDNDKVLLVYEVHTGNPFVYDGWYKGNSFPLTYDELSKRGFDSTYVKAGGGLLNSEIIAYTEKQNRIKHIIWLKD